MLQALQKHLRSYHNCIHVNTKWQYSFPAADLGKWTFRRVLDLINVLMRSKQCKNNFSHVYTNGLSFQNVEGQLQRQGRPFVLRTAKKSRICLLIVQCSMNTLSLSSEGQNLDAEEKWSNRKRSSCLKRKLVAAQDAGAPSMNTQRCHMARRDGKLPTAMPSIRPRLIGIAAFPTTQSHEKCTNEKLLWGEKYRKAW